MTSPYSFEAMRARFQELTAQIAQIESTSPRIARDENFLNLTVAELASLKEQIKAHEAGLFELKTEYAFLAKALGGKSMSDGGV